MSDEQKSALIDASVIVESASQNKVSFEEFLSQTSDGTWAEWVNGDVIYMTVSKKHVELVGFLVSILRAFIEAKQIGSVFMEPFLMKINPDSPGRAPDLFFVSKENLPRLQNTYFDGAADLVIEIISPESRSRDRGEKYYEYEQGGVKEYWLIDPLRKQAEFYQLGEDGIYRIENVDSKNQYHSRVLKGLWLKVDWLWQETPPTLLSVFKEWKLI
ncbi:MAG: Uma2 family endonuclease [Acidobacteria bacterium]|nr:Uma2 family endonuclease [Acidobacteriota bacterium]